MDYVSLFKKAYNIVIKNKFLWVFGFLIGGSLGFNNFGWGGGTGYNNEIKDEQIFPKINNFISQYWLWILIAVIIIFIIFIIFFVLSIISRGALIGSVNKINNSEKTSLSDGFKIGIKNFWQILGITVILFSIFFITILIFIICSIFILIIPIIGWLIGLFLIFLIIPIIFISSFLINVISQMAYCYCIIENRSISQSFKAAWQLFKNHWKNLLIIFLFLLLISFVFGIALFIIIILLSITFLLIGFIIYYGAGILATIIYALLIILLILIISAGLSGILNAYVSTVWVLTYLNLTKNLLVDK